MEAPEQAHAPAEIDTAFMRRVVDRAPEAIVICSAQLPDYPVLYVNSAFERLTGYAAAEVLGGSLRILQGEDRDQEAIGRLRQALQSGEPCRVLVRNYRKNGELFWNELEVQTMRDDGGVLTHFVAFYRDAASRLRNAERSQEGLPGWSREDRVTGLSSRAWFDELLAREWRIARREGLPLSLLLFDIDALASYNQTYGKAAGDACLRRIAGSIAGVFRRGSDVVGVWSEGCIGVLAVHRGGSSVAGVVEHAQSTVRRIAEMRIHHPRSPLQRYVTVTAGLATVTPERDEEQPSRLIGRADQALAEAKRDLRGGLNQAPD